MQSIHNLPRELLDTLTLQSLRLHKPPPPDNKHVLNADSTDDAASSGANVGARACNICLGVTFMDVDEQRIHFRSDWHRYNVKTRLSGGQAVSEEAFSRLVEALDDSLSGSASSSEEESSGEGSSDAVTTLINKTKRLGLQVNSEAGDEASLQNKVPQSPLVWFNSSKHHTQLGIYRTIFPSYIESDMYLDELREMQSGGPDGRTWAMFMVAGGHFAGAIVKVGRSDEERKKEEEAADGRKKKAKKPIVETEVLRHKTFHRYTTRRKQGGSQSLNDNAKGSAKSAGALLRRYGEQALRDDIRNLLLDWAEDIDACERIWIRASTSNRRILIDFEGLITKGDVRLRTFPFPTRRPTQSELARCLLELIKPKVSHLTEEELREQDEAYLASIKPKHPKPALQPPSQQSQPLPLPKPRLTKDDEILKNKWIRAFDMISRDRLEAFKAFLDREADALGGINALLPEYACAEVNGSLKRTATFLQAAAAAGSEGILQWLLTDRNADPTIPVPMVCRDDDQDIPDDQQEEADGESVPLKPGGHRTAYDLSKTKAVRDIFRRCAAAYPDNWDWFVAGRVPSGLNKQMEDERDERKKARRKGLKEKFKEREREAATKKVAVGMVESIPEPSPASKPENRTGPQKLGGVSGAIEGIAGLAPDMRARVERERRARAAEARLKGLRQ